MLSVVVSWSGWAFYSQEGRLISPHPERPLAGHTHSHSGASVSSPQPAPSFWAVHLPHTTGSLLLPPGLGQSMPSLAWAGRLGRAQPAHPCEHVHLLLLVSMLNNSRSLECTFHQGQLCILSQHRHYSSVISCWVVVFSSPFSFSIEIRASFFLSLFFFFL